MTADRGSVMGTGTERLWGGQGIRTGPEGTMEGDNSDGRIMMRVETTVRIALLSKD